MIKRILFGVGITTVVSVVFGYTLKTFFGGWLDAFVFAFLLQLIGHYFYNDIKIRKDALAQEKLINERFDILSRNFVKFNCPCGDNIFEEIIYPGEENTFVCEKCNQLIKVNMELTPVLVTTPLAVNPIEKLEKLIEE